MNSIGDDQLGTTALFIASQNGHVEIVRVLLDGGADTEIATSNAVTPLLVASSNGHAQVVKVLLKANANVEQVRSIGFTALLSASQFGHSAIVGMLLVSGADPNHADLNGFTPLHLSSVTLGPQSEDIAKILLLFKAEIDRQSAFGATPLIYAAYYGNMGTLQILLENGANKTIGQGGGVAAVNQICGCVNDAVNKDWRQCPKGGCDQEETAARIEEMLI